MTGRAVIRPPLSGGAGSPCGVCVVWMKVTKSVSLWAVCWEGVGGAGAGGGGRREGHTTRGNGCQSGNAWTPPRARPAARVRSADTPAMGWPE
jgi:hypothetical protein